MVDVTKTDQAIMERIGDHWAQYGYAPSVRDLIRATPTVNSTATVKYHLDLLVAAGLLSRTGALERNIKLAPPAFPYLRSTSVVTRLTLPYPISVNALWAPRRGGGFRLTEEGKNYKQEAGWQASTQIAGRELLNGDLAICARYYRASKRGDIDNLSKALLDSLNKIVYEDDNQFVEQHSFFDFDAADPRVEIEIWKVC